MIEIDLRNTAADRLGSDHGIEWDRELAAWSEPMAGAVQALANRSDDAGAMLGWTELPEQDLSELEALLDALPSGISDLVVLGIGGSSLGALTVTSALQHPYRHLLGNGSGVRVHFVDNVDPDAIGALQETLAPEHTLVNVISKSGSTAETMAAFLSFRAWLEGALGDRHAEHLVATTDPENGILRRLARERGYRSLPVPASVGGRFSVMSNVGLLPIALAGCDYRSLLAGAKRANRAALRPLRESAMQQATLVQYLAYRRGKHLSVLMPYSNRLRYLGAWFVQLWAESLGKAVDRRGSRVHVGSTPIAALGATDQHSQVQLFNEGPNDKLIAFIRIGEFDAELTIPESGAGAEELSYLSGHGFGQLLNAEQRATAFALAQNQRPNYTLTLPRLDAESLGELLQFLMWQTALMGELLGIDAFDQPGVELGKRYTYALMGRAGFERDRERLEEALVDS